MYESATTKNPDETTNNPDETSHDASKTIKVSETWFPHGTKTKEGTKNKEEETKNLDTILSSSGYEVVEIELYIDTEDTESFFPQRSSTTKGDQFEIHPDEEILTSNDEGQNTRRTLQQENYNNYEL